MNPITFNKNIPNKEDKLLEPLKKRQVKVANLFFNNGIDHYSSITIKFGNIKNISVVNYYKDEKSNIVYIDESITLTSDVDIEVLIPDQFNNKCFEFTMNFSE